MIDQIRQQAMVIHAANTQHAVSPPSSMSRCTRGTCSVTKANATYNYARCVDASHAGV